MPGVLQVADVEDLKLDAPIGWSMEEGLEIKGQVFSGVGLSGEELRIGVGSGGFPVGVCCKVNPFVFVVEAMFDSRPDSQGRNLGKANPWLVRLMESPFRPRDGKRQVEPGVFSVDPASMAHKIEAGGPFDSAEVGPNVSESEEWSVLERSDGLALDEGVEFTMPYREVNKSLAVFEMEPEFAVDLVFGVEVGISDFVASSESGKHRAEAFGGGGVLA